MKHKKLLLLVLALISVLILLGLAWSFLGGSGSGNSGQEELEVFQNIELRVDSADVTIEEGEKYAISYTLHSRETVTQLEVKDGTLYFDTGFDMGWKPGNGSWSIVITVPSETEFGSLNLTSTAGAIRLTQQTFKNGTFESTSGAVELSKIACDTVSAKSVSGDVSLENSTISNEAALETVSGKINAKAPFASIQAKSVGKIELNGGERGGKLYTGEDLPALKAASVSGHISIETKTAS